MNNTELLFNLLKKLESGEIKVLIGERKGHFNIHLDDNDKGNSIKIAVVKKTEENYQIIDLNVHYEPS